MALMKRVWEVYGPMSGLALSQLTHDQRGPWDVIRKKYPDAQRQPIPNRLIQKHFERKIQESDAEKTASS